MPTLRRLDHGPRLPTGQILSVRDEKAWAAAQNYHSGRGTKSKRARARDEVVETVASASAFGYLVAHVAPRVEFGIWGVSEVTSSVVGVLSGGGSGRLSGGGGHLHWCLWDEVDDLLAAAAMLVVSH